MSEQGVAIGEVRVGVQRDGGDFQLARERAAVQAFDVAELVNVPPAAGVDLARCHRPEHEGVIGVGAVRDMDCAGNRGRHDAGLRGFCAWRTASAWKFVNDLRWSSYSGRLSANSACSWRRKSA